MLAERARRWPPNSGLECEVLDRDRMRQLGMGALLGVAQGSRRAAGADRAALPPAKPAGSDDHLGLVGKGVTFDTGGISIKPAEGMEKMKYDMAGGAAVLGAMRAIAQLKPRHSGDGASSRRSRTCPAAARSGPATSSRRSPARPIEVLNTDAEGRLILADAITYAKRLGCTHLVDAATLTGAIVVALGHVNVGAFANDEALLATRPGRGQGRGREDVARCRSTTTTRTT